MYAVFRYIVFAGVVCAATAAVAVDIRQLSFNGIRGYEIPIPGTKVLIDGVMVGGDGQLIFETESFDNGKSQYNFYDPKNEKWLFAEPITQKRKIALAEKKFKKQGYGWLPHLPELGFKNGRKVTNILHINDICFRPYANFITFVTPPNEDGEGGEIMERAVYTRLDQPEEIFSEFDTLTEPHTVASSHTCKDAAGNDPELTRNYRMQSAFFFSDNANGFFALISRYAIHFDSDGNSDFFRGRDNPVLMSAEDTSKIKNILLRANRSRSPQDAVKQVEDMIEKTAQEQKAMQP